MNEVAIVDTGGANIASVRYALKRLGHRSRLIDNSRQLARSGHVILPGVGAAGIAMQRLAAHDMIEALRDYERPVLGICLGMQLLCDQTEEDESKCLTIVGGQVYRMTAAASRPVPHMGWAQVQRTGESVLLNGIANNSYFYFVHSYALAEIAQTKGVTHYGESFSSVIEQDNFYGTQFHPEKSSTQGAKLLSNFLGLV